MLIVEDAAVAMDEQTPARSSAASSGSSVAAKYPRRFSQLLWWVNLYEDKNAFVLDGMEWFCQEVPIFRRADDQVRMSNRQFGRLSSITRTQDPGYGWTSYTPISHNGYPRTVWDLSTGVIDQEVVAYMKEHDYDPAITEAKLGNNRRQLAGKLHLYCGDEDGGYFTWQCIVWKTS